MGASGGSRLWRMAARVEYTERGDDSDDDSSKKAKATRTDGGGGGVRA